MDTKFFMNSENSKTHHPHRVNPHYSISHKTDLRMIKYVALSNLMIIFLSIFIF